MVAVVGSWKIRAKTEKIAKGLSQTGFGRSPADQADAEKIGHFTEVTRANSVAFPPDDFYRT